MSIRYSFGGDEFIFAEISEAMSLPAFFSGMAITRRLQEANIAGITEICPANASYQIRFNPDIISAETLLEKLQTLEADIADAPRTLETRLIEIPVLFNDPWTRETGAKFRERHQDPSSTDIEYAARINGFENIEGFIKAYSDSPWFVSMVGFVSGLPFMFQMVPQEAQLEVPKYLRPRTDTPKQTIGHGGCFSCIYSVRGAGGYQMFGVTPAPIFDPEQRLSYLQNSMVLFRPGDIVKFQAIDRETYDQTLAKAEDGTLALNIRPIAFDLDEYLADPQSYNRRLLGETA